jgi:hypothetical protein
MHKTSDTSRENQLTAAPWDEQTETQFERWPLKLAKILRI